MDPITIAMGLAAVAPQIVKWLTGSDKAEEVAQTVVEVAQQVTGRMDPLDATAALKADPNLALEFRKALLAQEAEMERLHLEDVQDARKRDTEIAKVGRYNWRSDVLAFLSVGGLITCVYFVAQDINLPERAVNAIMFVAGVLASAVRDVYNFEFGSSRGSNEKNATIEKLLTKRW